MHAGWVEFVKYALDSACASRSLKMRMKYLKTDYFVAMTNPVNKYLHGT